MRDRCKTILQQINFCPQRTESRCGSGTAGADLVLFTQLYTGRRYGEQLTPESPGQYPSPSTSSTRPSGGVPDCEAKGYRWYGGA